MMMKFRLDATSCATVAAATASADVDVDVNRIMNFTQNVELEYYAREEQSEKERE